jgi:hypothetical protein
MAAEVIMKAFVTVKKEKGEYALVCSSSSDLGEAYTAWQEIGNWIVDRIQADLAARKPQEAAQEQAKADEAVNIENKKG